MRVLDMEDIKKVELGTLTRIDTVCKENGLRYYICGGTLLGAVRHKGFIPWDDDIDLLMPRPDFERLLELMAEDERYLAVSPLSDGCYYNFAKIVDRETTLTEFSVKPIPGMGVYVDIFPLDGLPEDERERNKQFRRLHKLRDKMFWFAHWRPKFRKNLFALLKSYYIYYIRNKCTRLGDLQREYIELANRYNYETAAYVYASGGAYLKKDIFPKEIFADTVQLEFEGRLFSAPAAWDAYLKQLYGDYMQLPPVENRVSRHDFEARYKEK